jgi:hypothetical protein
MGEHYLRLTPFTADATPNALGAPSREDVGYFFINSFLLSRIDSDMPSDLKEYDEDVNVYTASLLAGIVTGREDSSAPTSSRRATPTSSRASRTARTSATATRSTRRTPTSSTSRSASSAGVPRREARSPRIWRSASSS